MNKKVFCILLLLVSCSSKIENLEYDQLKKEVKEFQFLELSNKNINNFNALNVKINNFIKKYPKAKNRIKKLEEDKIELKKYIPAIEKYFNFQKAQTIYELEGDMYDWDSFESVHKNENVGKLMKNSRSIIKDIYETKAQKFEKERLEIVKEFNSPKIKKENITEDKIYFKNCKEAKAKGYSAILKGKSGYRIELDKNHNGIACE